MGTANSVSPAPTGPLAALGPSPEQQIFVASQWQLMWWKFRKHRMALVSVVVILALYGVGVFCEFVAVQDPGFHDARFAFAPPQPLHFLARDPLRWEPHVYGYQTHRDPDTLAMVHTIDETKSYRVHVFAPGEPYKLWGLIPLDRHLLAIESDDGTRLTLLGTDRLGRDMFSRLVYGTRISMSIGLLGVAISLGLGIVIGGISGYYGGMIDLIIQRVIEFVRSMPTIPLWMALSAAMPPDWSPLTVYFGITVILSLISWTGLARVVRGKFLSLREEDFVMAAQLNGSSELRIILRHMVPSFLSYIIASITLSIPGMILSETSLSFLGLGLRPPVVSWGVLLREAQNVRSVALAPWLLVPAVLVVLSVLAYNFMGDGLRDAADPYR
jgi:peptide/nickel transport system permease protein